MNVPELIFDDEHIRLYLGDGRTASLALFDLGIPTADTVVVSDPPTEMGFPLREHQAAHLIVHPHYLWCYPMTDPKRLLAAPLLHHVSAWIRPTPGITRAGFGHHWNAVLHYGPADLPTDVFWDDAPRVTAHPAERGVQPLIDLISALPDGVILDPFCGTGSVLLAARACGRRAVGVELDPGWAEVARQRLAG